MSPWLSYNLRHNKHMNMDSSGWVYFDDLIARYPLVTKDNREVVGQMIKDIVKRDQVGRYEVVGDQIRATSGHTVSLCDKIISPTTIDNKIAIINQPTQQTTDQPYCQSPYQPTDQPYCQSPNQPTYQPTYQSTYQPIYQPTCQSIYQPTYQATYQPPHHPTYQPTYQPTCHPTYQPTCHPTYQPTYQATYQATYQPPYQPTYHPTCQPYYF